MAERGYGVMFSPYGSMVLKALIQALSSSGFLFTSITFDYVDDIPSFAVNCVFNLVVVVSSTFGGAFNIRLGIKGFTSQAVVTFSD